MTIKRLGMMAVLAVAVVALAVPLVGLRARASGSAPAAPVAIKASATVSSPAEPSAQAEVSGRQRVVVDSATPQLTEGRIKPEVVEALGYQKLPEGVSAREASEAIAAKLKGERGAKKRSAETEGSIQPQSGQPRILGVRSALSAAIATTLGGRDTQFSEVVLTADWDGREDCAADREAKVDDFSGVEIEIDQTLTRVAISEHTVANGFNENIYYYGDSLGNVWVGADTDLDGAVNNVVQINLPTVLNAFGSLLGDDQVTITGLAVSPVADLTSFPNVNPAYAGFAGQTGEILYVTYHDTESGLRLAANNIIVRSGLLAFPIADLVSPAPVFPILSSAGFPVTVGGAFGVAFSVFSNVAGCAVDDDGSVYFQQVDLIQFTGANVVKVQSLDSAAWQDRSLAVSGIITLTTLNPAGGVYGTTSGPVIQVNRFTNYSGTSTTFGNIVALATGGCNTLYAALARSAGSGDPITEGLFPAPAALSATGTPSMVISFADCAGAFDVCSGLASLGQGIFNVGGQIPAANGFADVAAAGVPLSAGVNNFRVFVLGNGPDIRPPAGQTSAIVTSGTLKVDMQIDYTAHAGLAVTEEGTVFVISGGTPAGIGKNPSPMLGEILCFEDMCAMDRRADFVDLRGNGLPNPPLSGGSVGDGDSDRFDHIFYQAPLDQVTLTPTGLAGLARGFLRYTNRLAPNPMGPGVTLGVIDPVQGDDDTDGYIIFEAFDPGHQAAGGDDQNPPFRGDDDNGAGTPVVAGPLSGGFEFVFGGPRGVANCVWNGFYLNSNGNVTFGGGDTDNTPTVPEFRANLPKIAPAWADLNPNARNVNAGTFPVQALGFANVNAFKVRWINVPEFGSELCVGLQAGATNTFAVTLYDDGTGIDENANQPLNPANPIGNNAVPFDLQEGPTDLRFTVEPTTGVLVGCPSRPDGTGHFFFEYCRMDLLGTAGRPVLVGYSIGALNPLNPPGMCEINLGEAARAADANPFGVIQGQTASIMPCLIGEGTEPTLFELFNEGSDAAIGSGGEITLATPDFDLRFEGNDAALCTPLRQRDLNRGKLGFYGIGCAPPPNPQCLLVTPVLPVAVAPDQPAVGSAAAACFVTSGGAKIASPTTGIINGLCAIQLNMIGCGFFPNETTIICQGFSSETGVPLQRPGKTVTSAMSLACDTNGDGVPEATVALTNVTPINKNLVRGTLAPLTAAGLPGTAFPLACCGCRGTLTLTTTFSAGDNNAFGLFTRSTACVIDLGLRAPVVISATPSDGNCATPQDLLISGACFIINGVANVTTVFAVEQGNPANRINATAIQILTPTLVDALFNFGTANAGKTFLIHATGPSGTSRNLTALPAGAPAGCPLGNEQGIQVTFRCNSATNPGGGGTADLAVVTACRVDRSASGKYSLVVTGSNFKAGARLTVNGAEPKKLKFKDETATGSNTFNKLVAIGKFCDKLPGPLVVFNGASDTRGSQPFQCNATCQ